MIDTHAHLLGLPGGADAAVHEAAAGGVRQLVCVAQGPDEAHEALALADRHPNVSVVAGLHPHRAAEWSEDLAAELEAVLAHPRAVAVGETGLDWFRDRAPRDAQHAAFRGQVGIAERLGLPLVIHTREAADDTLAVLRETTAPVVLHCFSLPDHLDEAAERGWYVSFAGNVTYPSATALQEAARRTPAQLLLLETDSPYLAPVPHRGTPNRPERVLDTLRFVAGLRGEEPGKLGRVVEANAARVFGL